MMVGFRMKGRQKTTWLQVSKRNSYRLGATVGTPVRMGHKLPLFAHVVGIGCEGPKAALVITLQ